jgi:predicted flap endonuclease-1-like 5' DNA nuclease
MDFLLQDTSFLLLILAIIALMGVLIGWSLRASMSERPILEAYERLEQDRNSLARLYAQLKDQHEMRMNEIKKLNAEITQLRQEVSSLEIDKAVRHSENEVFVLRLAKAEADAAHYAEKIYFLEEQSAQLRKENASLLLDMDRLREELKAWMALNRDFAGMQKRLLELDALQHAYDKERQTLQQQLELARAEVENLQLELLRRAPVSNQPANTFAAPSDERTPTTSTHPGELPASDDLTQIKGISAFVEKQLRAIGVQTFLQISNWDESTARTAAAALGLPPEKILTEDWIGQAKQLVKTNSRKKR